MDSFSDVRGERERQSKRYANATGSHLKIALEPVGFLRESSEDRCQLPILNINKLQKNAHGFP
ncbi:MAG: hypothetical protein CML13_19850 [Puniceicoccaceae bacterium]|nr:hypothetical protein [Puniceicoccaceae bacterium]